MRRGPLPMTYRLTTRTGIERQTVTSSPSTGVAFGIPAGPICTMTKASLQKNKMLNSLLTFVVHWCVLTILLWLASKVFHGIQFRTGGALWLSALLLGF